MNKLNIAQCVTGLFLSGCAHLGLAPKIPEANAVLIGPAVIKLVSTFRNCPDVVKKIKTNDPANLGQYSIWFDLDRLNPHISSFQLRRESLPSLNEQAIKACEAIALKRSNQTVIDTFNDPKYTRFLEYSDSNITIAKGGMWPQPYADIMSESGTVLAHFPAPGMDWN